MSSGVLLFDLIFFLYLVSEIFYNAIKKVNNLFAVITIPGLLLK